jgi:superfamily II DNA or RNA helicase
MDRAIFAALTPGRVEGPWELAAEAGFALLQRAVATGRAYWRSLQGAALRWTAARALPFSWEILPNGDQRLRCETPADIVLDLEPPVYIDTTSAECGLLELPYPVDLLRKCWNQAPIEPQRVSDFIAELAHEARAQQFPRPRELTVLDGALESLGPRLVLTAAPAAIVHFIYNGVGFDGRTLACDAAVVRLCDGDRVYRVQRDLERERQLTAQLEATLGTPADDTAWFTFMMSGVPQLKAGGWEIAIDPDFPYRIAVAEDWYADMRTTPAPRAAGQQAAGQPTGPRSTRGSREWFDLRLGVRVDGLAVNVLPALVHYLQRETGPLLIVADHLLILLDDGRYLPVPMARIARIADVLVELFEPGGLNEGQALRLPAHQAGRLAQLCLEPHAPGLQSDDPALLECIDAIKNFSSIEPLGAPAGFQATLRPYQQQGLGWMQYLRRHALGGILADDMGLGKTVQTLAHLLLEKHEGRLKKPVLIVAPVSVLGNWSQEIRRYAPDLVPLVLHGPKRSAAFGAIDSADLVIIGYPLLLIDSEILLNREFSVVILDEAQMIKNPQAKVSRVARALRAQHRLCLTGTPVQNNLGELWSLIDFVQPGLLGERQAFQRHYRTPIENAGDGMRAAALSRRIRPFLLRRTKDAVARDLPPKIEILEPIELDERQRDFYDGVRLGQHRRVREAIENRGLARSHIMVLDALLKLRQACCDPRLVAKDSPSPDVPSAKLEWLSSTLPDLIAAGRRILLFSQFTSMLRLIENAVQALSIPYLLLTGETRQRTELVTQFQSGGVPLFLISLKAGGTGLNLTAADTIIHYDPWWNPAVEAQATDRAHRIGQRHSVFVYKLIAQRTIEEKILELQADKHALVSRLYGEAGGASPLNSADIDALFAP